MTFRHNSRSPQFRSPFGAVPCNTTVHLSCQVDSCQAQETTCTLRIWIDGEGETLIAMDRGESGMFSTTFTRDTPAIVWYSFIICQADGTEVRIGAPAGAQGGEDHIGGDRPSQLGCGGGVQKDVHPCLGK